LKGDRKSDVILEIDIFQAPATDLLGRRARGCAAELTARGKTRCPSRFTEVTECELWKVSI